MVASIGMLLAACTSRGAEASMNLDLADLKPLLKSVQRLTQNGFGDSEVEQVDGLARSLPGSQTKELQFQVVFHGSNASMRLQVKKDDVDAVSVWFITSPELAGAIQGAMKPFLH
jgi:hypothetical protein